MSFSSFKVKRKEYSFFLFETTYSKSRGAIVEKEGHKDCKTHFVVLKFKQQRAILRHYDEKRSLLIWLCGRYCSTFLKQRMLRSTIQSL